MYFIAIKGPGNRLLLRAVPVHVPLHHFAGGSIMRLDNLKNIADLLLGYFKGK